MPAIRMALVTLWEGTRLTALHERFFAFRQNRTHCVAYAMPANLFRFH